jgi:hypothetical protein
MAIPSVFGIPNPAAKAQSTSVVIVSTTLMNPSGVATTTAAGHSSVVTASNTPGPSASTTPSGDPGHTISVFQIWHKLVVKASIRVV